MTRPPDPRLAQLAQLAGMVRDARLAELRRAADAHRDAAQACAALGPAASLQADDGGPVMAAARMRWTEAARASANARLAIARAEDLTARAAAARALGRAEALHRLSQRGGRG